MIPIYRPQDLKGHCRRADRSTERKTAARPRFPSPPVQDHLLLETKVDFSIILGLEDAELLPEALVDSKDFKGLRVLAAATGERFRRGVVLYTGNEVLPFGPNFYAAPVAALWSRPKGV